MASANNRLTKVHDFLTGHETATTLPWDPNCTRFPRRRDVSRREDAPVESAWVWGIDDYIGRLNLLTPKRVAAASKTIKSGDIVPLNLPLNVPDVPAFNRELFRHEINHLGGGVCYDDKYTLNTQSGTQWDGFRHMAHFPSKSFYNGTKAKDIQGPESSTHKCGMHHWAEHGIAGRGVLLDYYGYAQEKGLIYDPYEYHEIPWSELQASGKAQGLDIRPAAEGGDIEIGDLLFIRSGFVSAYHSKTPAVRSAAALRKHIPEHDEQQWAGVSQEEDMIDWLHDCYFSAVAGDSYL